MAHRHLQTACWMHERSAAARRYIWLWRTTLQRRQGPCSRYRPWSMTAGTPALALGRWRGRQQPSQLLACSMSSSWPASCPLQLAGLGVVWHAAALLSQLSGRSAGRSVQSGGCWAGTRLDCFCSERLPPPMCARQGSSVHGREIPGQAVFTQPAHPALPPRRAVRWAMPHPAVAAAVAATDDGLRVQNGDASQSGLAAGSSSLPGPS